MKQQRAFVRDAGIVARALGGHLARSRSRGAAVIRQAPMERIIGELELDRFATRGGLTGGALRRWMGRYLSHTTRLHHPAYLAHQVAVPHPSGSLASMIDGFTNNAMAIYEMGPAAAAIEAFVVDWLIRKVGWQPAPWKPAAGAAAAPGGGAAGVLTHGGSLANLTALVAARTRLVPQVWDQGSPGDLALLAPEGSHYSIARAAGILGLGARSLYGLETDGRGVIRVDRVPATCRRLREDGRRAIALVANACSTAVGCYDPLRELGELCRAEGIWLHVDGAHGASALLSPTHRIRLDGVELADSLVWDAHKLLRTPTLCAAVLVRDGTALDAAFHQEASYLFHEKEQPGIDLIHRTVECTKAGLGLRLFFVLSAQGEAGLAGYIDGVFALAHDAWRLIDAQPDFSCALEPESNIVCFRYTGHGDDEALQIALRDRLIAEGGFYLSTTMFAGRRWLRMAVMSPATTMGDIERLLARIRDLATAADAGARGGAR
jgi:L-2,4-diaminobutyrate decarboxylase